MIYEDLIHGRVEISEPVILDLINCSAIQRLKKIDQAGYSEPYFPNTKHNRFEHSMGDYLLLKKYEASIEEQISGLIHDVSHSAFSHCIDYVLDAGSQTTHDYQDSIFNDFVYKTEIPEILKKYNFNVEFVLDEKNFPLQERDLPDLCADRIDYSLRTSIIFKESSKADVSVILNNLIIQDKHWIFENFEIAKKYAELFLRMNNKYYSGILSGVMFLTVGDYLRYAIINGYINEEDLYSTDDALLAKIEPFRARDMHLEMLFNRMDRKIGFESDSSDYYSKVSCKSRVVDPLFKSGNKIERVSDVDVEWRYLLEKYSKPKDYFIKFEK